MLRARKLLPWNFDFAQQLRACEIKIATAGGLVLLTCVVRHLKFFSATFTNCLYTVGHI